MSTRMPAIYLPHGGGPWPIVDMGFGDAYAGLEAYLRALPASLPAPPRAVLCVSAHWEAKAPTVMGSGSPPMLYDYFGFPDVAYEFTWGAPGAPEVATEVLGCLAERGIEGERDDQRGFDHGTFVPLMLSWPEADVPTLQLSLVAGLDPEVHLEMGRALAPLRDQGILIIGSGMSYHNMRGFQEAFRSQRGRDAVRDESRVFDDWLVDAMSGDASARAEALVAWASAPNAREAHPREEHLLPLMVVAGSAEGGRASAPFRGALLGAQVSAVHFEG